MCGAIGFEFSDARAVELKCAELLRLELYRCFTLAACGAARTGPETAILFSVPISYQIRCVKFCGAVSRVSTTARASENSNPIAKNTRFHASARARPGLFRLSKILCRGQHILAQQRAHQRIQTQSLKTLDFMQVRVRGLVYFASVKFCAAVSTF